MQKGRNANPPDAVINRFPAVHGYPPPIFSNVIDPKTFPKESADVYARKRMDFASNSVVAESPNFLDLGLLPANIADKLKSIILNA